jgi:putative addiction module CopG family antidote
VHAGGFAGIVSGGVVAPYPFRLLWERGRPNGSDFDPAQEAFIREGIESGRYRTAEDAVREALAFWEEKERARVELIAACNEAEADLASGAFSDYTDATLPELVEELKREAREFRNRRPD